MTQQDLQKILNALDRTNRLLVMLATAGMNQTKAIAALHKAGLPPKEIGDYLGTTSNTVSVTLARRGKKKVPKKVGLDRADQS